MGDMGAVNPYLATALRGYKTALDAALSAASWLAQPGGGGGGGGPYDGPRPQMDRPSGRSDGIEVSGIVVYERYSGSDLLLVLNSFVEFFALVHLQNQDI